MKVIMWICMFLFLVSPVFSVSIENAMHTSSSNIFIYSVETSDELFLDENFHFSNSSVVMFRIGVLKNQTLISDYENALNSSIILFKVSEAGKKVSVSNLNHTAESYFVYPHFSNGTSFIRNNSLLYTSFIKTINTTYPIIIVKPSGFLNYNGNSYVYPFNAMIESFAYNNSRMISVTGNSIEGEVAALRYLKENIDVFNHEYHSVLLNDEDALMIYDYMHLADNQKWFNTDTSEFRSIVNDSLFSLVNESVIDVKTNDGVLLRVLKAESKNSEKFKSYVNNDSMPIVFARGLWSNLYSWQSFGDEMATSGNKVYLIEITGGPGQDCFACVNYDFNDLIFDYWPALIGTVQTLENGSKIRYVGHSNGARTGISSLEIYNEVGKQNAGSYFDGLEWVNVSMTAHPIDTYIAVGMPGVFEGVNPVGSVLNVNKEKINEKIELNNFTHVSLENIFAFGLTSIKYASSSPNEKISKSLWADYANWISSENDSQPGQNVNLSNFLIMQGDILITSDGIVSTKDEELIYSNIISQNKAHVSLPRTHTGVADSEQSKRIINSFLSNKNLEDVKIKYAFQNITNQIYGGVIINETN